MHPVRILLVDDHAVVRAGFRYLLEKASERYEIVGADCAEEAYRLFIALKPQVVVMDLTMPGMGGVEGIRRILAKQAQTRILVLSMHEDLSFVSRVTRMGASGYVTKRSAPDELPRAVETVIRGKVYFSADIQNAFADHEGSTVEDRVKTLSEREFEIFCLLTEGRTVVEIAQDLSLSPKTVNNHRSSIMDKLCARNAVELVRIAVRQGVIQP